MPSPSMPGATAMVGREPELAVLSERLDGAAAGRGHLVCLVGEPGIGKTRLAAALATRARERGVRVLWGRCTEDAGAPAFWPWIQIIRGCVRDQDPETLLAQMGPGAADIAQIVAQVRERFPQLPAPPPLEPEQARFRLFDSVTAFLTNAARAQPLLLILDDLHWADAPSLLLLEFLGRELRASRLLVVGTYRDIAVDRNHPLARSLAALTRAEMYERLVLSGLDEPDVRRCIAAITGAEPAAKLVAAVQTETAGNPFFVTELARLLTLERDGGTRASAVSSGAPHGLRQVLDARLDRLSPACHRALTLAAVIGREFGLAELAQVAELAGDPLLEVLEQAEIARVIAAVPGTFGRYRFAHALVREALYDEIPTTRRIRLHRQVAEALEALYGAASHPHIGQLAHHFVQAAPGGDADKAVTYARRAGDAALAQLAYEEAARYYQMSLQVLEVRPPVDEGLRCALLLALGEAQNWSGEAEAAKQTFRRAAAIAAQLDDAEAVARAALGYGAVTDAGAVDHVRIALLEQARDLLGNRDSLLMVMVLDSLSGALYWSAQPEQSVQYSHQALEVAGRLADPVALTHALNARREALWRPEQLRDRVAVST
ncbi:MAG TPA: AAA family ATPase, partial [Dehalococcoidia bacterium]